MGDDIYAATDADLTQHKDKLETSVDNANEVSDQTGAWADQAGAAADQTGLLDLTHDAILVHDLNGQIRFWNQGAEECYGWSREEACGQKAQALLRTQFLIPRDEIIRRLFEEGRWEGELVQTQRDGEQITVASRWGLRRNAQGEPEAVLEINSDITERKRAEEALRESREDLQTLARRQVELQEQERQQLAYGLHDDAGQLLASLSVGLRVLEKRYGASPEARAHIVYLQEMVDKVQANVHRLGAELRPVSLDKLGLLPALRQCAAQFAAERGVKVTVGEAGATGSRLPREIEIALYRIVREALTNASRHGRLSRIDIMIQRRPDQVIGIVEDDGGAVDSDDARRDERLALLHMRQRVEMLGGSLSVEGGPPSEAAGMTVYAGVPFVEQPA
jgi:PAS domain S-box-containing protein